MGSNGMGYGSSEHGSESSCSIKGSGFLDWLSKYQLLEKDSAAWNSLDDTVSLINLKSKPNRK
jgi:hypothetical protein